MNPKKYIDLNDVQQTDDEITFSFMHILANTEGNEYLYNEIWTVCYSLIGGRSQTINIYK